MLILEINRKKEGSPLSILILLLELVKLGPGLIFRGESLHKNREAETALLSFHLFYELFLLFVQLGYDVDWVVFFTAEAVLVVFFDAVEDTG